MEEGAPGAGDPGPGWLALPLSLGSLRTQILRPLLWPLRCPQLLGGGRGQPLQGYLGLVTLQAGLWGALRPAQGTEDSLCVHHEWTRTCVLTFCPGHAAVTRVGGEGRAPRTEEGPLTLASPLASCKC